MTTARTTDRLTALRDELEQRYPDRWALLLTKLCEPRAHQHRQGDGYADCGSAGKRPLEPGWNREAVERFERSDERQAERRLEELARHLLGAGNIGLVVPPGFVVLDCDTPEAVAALATRVPHETPRQATAHGGHFGPLTVPDGLEVVARVGQELEADLDHGLRVDVRAGGRSQIVCAPSVHAQGARYEWERRLPDHIADLPDLPAAIVQALEAPGVLRRKGAESSHAPGDSGPSDSYREGERNDRLFREGCALRGRGYGVGAIHSALLALNAERCQPPLDPSEVQSIAASAARHEPGGAKAREEPPFHGDDEAPRDRPTLNLFAAGFSGDRLRALREREQTTSPLPELLDSEPHLHLLQAAPKTGKTTLALKLARDWALGCAPWPGAPALPGTRAVILSAEQSVARIDSVLRRLSLFADRGSIEEWTDRISIIARDRELARVTWRRLAPLGSDAVADLRTSLLRHGEGPDPVGLLVLDSLSRLKPRDAEENSNDDMSRWLDALDALAQATGVYVLLIHHQGHAAREDARTAGRGASAIGACAQGLWLLRRVDGPGDALRQRELRIEGNDLLPRVVTFEVCGEGAEPGAINYWRPVDPDAGHRLEDLLGVGEEIPTKELARRLAGGSSELPSGAAERTAARLRDRWEREGRVHVRREGSSKLVRRTA